MIRASIRPRQLERWVCSSCLFNTRPGPARQLRRLTHALTSTVAARPEISASQATGQRGDDVQLRSVFDSPRFWNDFSQVPGNKNAGLFQNAFLQTPDGFLTFARVSLKRARAIVDKVLKTSSIEEYRMIVRYLDRLSDILCRVLDMADFVRVTHPNPTVQSKASEAWDMVYQYMNELNTMTGLNDQLSIAMANPDVTSVWSEEEKAVAEVLKLDFTKSAVNLPQNYRDRFVQLSSEISTAGSAFVQEMSPEQLEVIISSSHLRGMDPVQARDLTRGGRVHIPTLSAQAALALRTVHDQDARKLLFYASRTASKRSVQILEYMMQLRSELATLSGFKSYAHLALRDRMMARSPEAVLKFLRALAKNNSPKAKQEMKDLLEEKKKFDPLATQLDPWDKDYYSNLVRRPMRQLEPRSDTLSSYFSLGVVMQGLSRLFTQLYGIRFVPKAPLPGETWHPDVRRLDVMSDTDGHVAVLYCDLFYRPDKSPNPAHFTLRCSRELSKDEMAEVWEQRKEDADMPQFSSPELAANDGMSYSLQNGTVKQLPTIALVCDFSKDSMESDHPPALLSFFQLETLFHEMGHAIHSILARTSFQNVSGTRCATDLAELPSTLMEYFAADPSVLALFARHWKTNEPLPYELVAKRIHQAKRFEASETENQIILAMLDQSLHSPKARGHNFDSTKIFHSLQRTFSSAPPDPYSTRWQGFFGHLSGYGSTYYSYLFDRVLAQRVWEVVFSAGQGRGALRRENGERLKESLLKWGGGRDPWKCLSDVLKEERLASGGEQAMALVGSWGSSKQSDDSGDTPRL